MFADKARRLPKSGALERCFTPIGFCLIHEQWTRLERPAREKHSGLLRKLVNCGRKKFYNNGPGSLSLKTFFCFIEIS